MINKVESYNSKGFIVRNYSLQRKINLQSTTPLRLEQFNQFSKSHKSLMAYLKQQSFIVIKNIIGKVTNSVTSFFRRIFRTNKNKAKQTSVQTQQQQNKPLKQIGKKIFRIQFCSKKKIPKPSESPKKLIKKIDQQISQQQFKRKKRMIYQKGLFQKETYDVKYIQVHNQFKKVNSNAVSEIKICGRYNRCQKQIKNTMKIEQQLNKTCQLQTNENQINNQVDNIYQQKIINLKQETFRNDKSESKKQQNSDQEKKQKIQRSMLDFLEEKIKNKNEESKQNQILNQDNLIQKQMKENGNKNEKNQIPYEKIQIQENPFAQQVRHISLKDIIEIQEESNFPIATNGMLLNEIKFLGEMNGGNNFQNQRYFEQENLTKIFETNNVNLFSTTKQEESLLFEQKTRNNTKKKNKMRSL